MAAVVRLSLWANGPIVATLLVIFVGAALALLPHDSGLPGDFYGVIPHEAMALLFGGVSLFVAAALVIGLLRFWRAAGGSLNSIAFGGLRDALTLRYLGHDESGSSARRVFHHLTFYGFLLCFASTSVATLYHYAFHWQAPYGYSSLPVVLGTTGGFGLLAGTVGLFVCGAAQPGHARCRTERHGRRLYRSARARQSDRPVALVPAQHRPDASAP